MCVVGSLRSHILDKVRHIKKKLFSRFAFDGDDYDDNYNYDYVVVVSGGGINIRVIAIMCHLQKIQNMKYSSKP